MQPVHALGGKRHRAVETECHRRRFEVVVDSLRHADDRQAFFVQLSRDGERAVPTDGNEGVEAVFPETAHDFVAAVDFFDRAVWLRDAHVERVAAIGRTENRAAEVRDVANDPAREFHQTTVGIFLGIEQSFDSIVDTEDFPAAVACCIYCGMNDRIQPWRVASAGKDGDAFDVSHNSVVLIQ